jgi:hypothetical protein
MAVITLTLITAGALAPNSGPPFRAVGPKRTAVGGPADGAPTLSAGAGTATAGLCLLAVAAIVAYGLYIIIA